MKVNLSSSRLDSFINEQRSVIVKKEAIFIDQRLDRRVTGKVILCTWIYKNVRWRGGFSFGNTPEVLLRNTDRKPGNVR